MFIDEIENDQQKNQFYTNNPDDAVYTNNPDVEENINKNNNIPFFNDDNENGNDNNKNEELINEKDDDNPFVEKKNLIKKNINKNDNKKKETYKIELTENTNNNLINPEKEEKENMETEIDFKKKETNEPKTNKEKEEKQIMSIDEDNKKKIKEKKMENGMEIEKGKKKIKKKPKKILQESNDENDTLVEQLLGQNDNNENNIPQNEERNTKNKRKIILSIIFGQSLALLCVGNGFFAKKVQGTKEENGKDIVIPLLLNTAYYFLLFLVYLFISKFKMKKPRLIYIILSLSDTQANFMNLFVFSYDNFKLYYPFIMNILSIIWAVVFTLILLRMYKYKKNHYIGIIICLIGVFAMILGSFDKFDNFIHMFDEYGTDVKGLLLCFIVSILYGLNAVLIEKYISEENDEINSYCSWLGIFGFVITALEAGIPLGEHLNEYSILFIDKKNDIDNAVIIFWILSAICLAAMTALSPLYIQKFQATMFNISLVFTIFWSYILYILESLFSEKQLEWHWINILYFFGFIITIIGTIIFSLKDRIRLNNFAYA